jgi:hypothetical protein
MLTGPYSTFLAACLRGTPESVAALPHQPGWNWENLFAAASAEALLPLLHRQLPRTVPPEIAGLLAGVAALNLERNRAILAELRCAVSLLNQAGIEPVLLKGAAFLVTGICPDRAARYLADLDLLLPEDQLDTAVTILAAHRFERDRLDAFAGFRHHHAPLHRPNAVDFELHRTLGSPRLQRLLPASEVVDRAVPFSFDGLRVRIPCPEHLLVHLIAHSQLQHSYNERIWPPLRAMCDLVDLQRHFGPALPWDRAAARFAAAGHRGLFVLHLLDVRDTFGFTAPVPLPLTPLTRLRRARRQCLRFCPALRYLDPVYMFSTVLRRRLAMFRKLLGTRHGIRHLLSQLLAPGNYTRLLTDLIAGRGR